MKTSTKWLIALLVVAIGALIVATGFGIATSGMLGGGDPANADGDISFSSPAAPTATPVPVATCPPSATVLDCYTPEQQAEAKRFRDEYAHPLGAPATFEIIPEEILGLRMTRFWVTYTDEEGLKDALAYLQLIRKSEENPDGINLGLLEIFPVRRGDLNRWEEAIGTVD